jgi:hypothetical protein
MANAIKAAKNLRRILTVATDSVSLAEKPRERLARALEKIEEVTEVLEDIHVNIVPLDNIGVDASLSENLSAWKNAAGCSIKQGSEVYDELLSNSNILKTLYRAGIDIEYMVKFSEEDLKFAKALGDSFQELKHALYKFSICLNRLDNQVGEYRSKVRFADADRLLFSLLERFKAVDGVKVQLYVNAKNKYVDFSFPELEKLQSRSNDTRIEFDWLRTVTQSFITGEWFNCYAYYIIDDHLSRNDFDYEIFTRVKYQAPPEISPSGSDFDIITMAGRKVLLVECKAGKLLGQAARANFDKIIEKADVIRKVFDLTNTNYYEYHFLLIYNHFSNKDRDVKNELAGTAIQPIRLNQIRGTVNQLFTK